MKQEVQLSLG